ncbi:hypothetical protein K0M31_016700 [Melipona bicolor]|uniref:Uncharacterized protein n=1 Tax=Melipona bicolor TaxID=60889 RepID=A0AA40FE68_9HYME|nr:hypothetical protein K0M31_016700 [Melipona bicolor]
MQRSAVITGEVRQLFAKRRVDLLLLQEPYAEKLGASGTVQVLGTRVGEAAVHSQYPWAAVALSNPNFEIIFVSQLSTPHCPCAEVLTPASPCTSLLAIFSTATRLRSTWKSSCIL